MILRYQTTLPTYLPFLHLLLASCLVAQADIQPDAVLKKQVDHYLERQHVLKWNQEINGLEILFTVFSQENAGRYPETWDELEKHFGEYVWSSKDEWRQLKQMVTLVPRVEGVFREPGLATPSKLRMLAVFSAPFDQKRDMNVA